MAGELGRCEEGLDAWRAWPLRDVPPIVLMLAAAAAGMALARWLRGRSK